MLNTMHKICSDQGQNEYDLSIIDMNGIASF